MVDKKTVEKMLAEHEVAFKGFQQEVKDYLALAKTRKLDELEAMDLVTAKRNLQKAHMNIGIAKDILAEM
jgi:hypothetical protein